MADRIQDVPKQTVQMAGPSKHGDLGIHYFNYFYYLLQATDSATRPTTWLLLGATTTTTATTPYNYRYHNR